MFDIVNTDTKPRTPASATVADLSPRAAELAALSRAKNTVRMYDSHWRHFLTWCEENRRDMCMERPARVVSDYVVALSDASLTQVSILSKMAAIRAGCEAAGISGLDDGLLKSVIHGACRLVADMPVRKALAAVPEILKRLLDATQPHTTPVGARNRAMFLLAFSGALRRSELVSIRLRDVAEVEGRGLQLSIRRSKTDQLAAGKALPIAANPDDPEFCPVLAVNRWLAHRGRQNPGNGLFLGMATHGGEINIRSKGINAETFARAVDEAAAKAGIDGITCHSMRRGLITSAARARISLHDTMGHARQRNVQTALGYVELEEMWQNTVTARVFKAAAG